MAISEVEEISEEEISRAANGDDARADFLNIDVSDALTDETPEAQAPPAEPTAEAAPATDPEADRGDGRNSRGEWVKKNKDGEPVAEPEVTVPVAEAATAVAETTTAPEVAGEPFTLRVSGQDFSLDGAQHIPGEGLYIPEAQIALTRQLMQEGAYYKQNWKALESQAEEKGYKRAVESDPDVQRARALVAQLDALFSGDQQALQVAYENWATQGPMYAERAKREVAERQLEEMRRGQRTQADEVETQRHEQEKQQTLTETIGELRAVPDLKVLTPEDWQWVDENIAMLNQRGGLFVQQDGETYLDVPAIERIAAQALRVRKQVVDVARKAEEAARFNAANRAQKPAVASAPTVTPRTGSAPKKEQQSSEPDARATRKAFLKGDLDYNDD